jgi:hypothetical protein
LSRAASVHPAADRPAGRTVGGCSSFWKSWRETKDLVTQQIAKGKPAAVLGLGAVTRRPWRWKTASLEKIPTAIINPDVIPGKRTSTSRDTRGTSAVSSSRARAISRRRSDRR